MTKKKETKPRASRKIIKKVTKKSEREDNIVNNKYIISYYD